MKINGLAIIPCAGFGTRMGMAPNKSKEMLPDPENDNKPIIDYSLNLCVQFKFKPLVILRKEKKDLKRYLKKRGVDFIEVDHKGEWHETVLLSESHWLENNILILPDTRFQLITNLFDIIKGLELGNNAVFATHEVSDPEKWGIIKDYYLFEKPKDLPGPQKAWGIVGFKNHYGFDLFYNMRYNSFKLKNAGFTHLLEFKDITRGK